MSTAPATSSRNRTSAWFLSIGYSLLVLGSATLGADLGHVGGFFGGLFAGAILGGVFMGVLYALSALWLGLHWGRRAPHRVTRVSSIAVGAAGALIGTFILVGALVAPPSAIPDTNIAATTAPDVSAPPRSRRAERQAIADYWNPIAFEYIKDRANYAATGMSAYLNDPVAASAELEKASQEADTTQLSVATIPVPDGVTLSDACPQTNMMFVYLKQSFDGMRGALDSRKPSDAADAQGKVQQADAWFFACRHDLAMQFGNLGGDPSTLQTMHLPR